MANYRVTKTTSGNATRNVGDQIVSTVEVDDANTSDYNQDAAGGAFPPTDMGPFTEGTPSVAFNPNPLPVAGAGTPGISFGNIGAVAVLEYTITNNAWLQANIDLRDTTAANWRIQMFDGATVIQTLTPAQLDNTYYGPFNSGTVRLEIERLTDPIDGVGDNEATITGYIIRTEVRSDVDFTDLVPTAPAGTTRTWEIDTGYTDASIVTAIGATTGTGDIVHTGIPFRVGGQLRYTITDTVTAEGVYQNTAAVAGTNVVAAAGSTLSGQEVTITPAVTLAPLELTKTTLGAATRAVGDVIESNVVVHANPESQARRDSAGNPWTGMENWVVESGTVSWRSAAAVQTALVPNINFETVGATASWTETNVPTGWFVEFTPGFADVGDPNNFWTLEVLDGATVIATPTRDDMVNFQTVNFGPINSGSVTFRVTLDGPTGNPDPVFDSTRWIGDMGVYLKEPQRIAVADPVPATPAGTTRTWTRTVSGCNTPDAGQFPGATSGTGDIPSQELLFLDSTCTVTYNILDTIAAGGTYQNEATGVDGAGALPSNGPIETSPAIGQLVTIPAQVGTASVTKTTNAPVPTRVGSVVPSTVVVTMANFGGTTVVSDPVPAVPAGTTRTWTRVDSPAGNVTPATASGTGDINQTLVFAAPGTATYTINDTVNAVGDYVNIVSIDGGPDVPGGPPTPIDPAEGTPTVTKTTVVPARVVPGTAITSTVTVTMTGGPGAVLVSDPIPAVPAGTTRTWTSTGDATGSAGTGTADINETITFAAAGVHTYTIVDTVNAAGDYVNNVNINGGPDTPGGPPIPVPPPYVDPTQRLGICCPTPGPGITPHIVPAATTTPEPCVTICALPAPDVGAPVTLGGQDCTGAALDATGTVGQLTQIVQAPGQVLSVRMCAEQTPAIDREMVVACNAAGDKVVVQYDVSTVPPTELARTNLNTGAVEPAGALVNCDNDDDDIEVVGVKACLNGVSLPGLAVVKDGGVGASTVLSELWRDPATGNWGALPAGAVVGECDEDEFFSQVFAEPGCANGVPWTRRHVQTFTNGIPNAPQDFYVDSAGAIQLVAPAGFTLGACVAAVVPPTAANTPIAFGQALANGTVTAGRHSVAFTNTGSTNATVNGGILLPGQTVSFEGYFDPVANVFNRLPAIPYTADVLSALSISEVF